MDLTKLICFQYGVFFSLLILADRGECMTRKKYEGNKLLNVTTETDLHANIIRKLHHLNMVDVWHESRKLGSSQIIRVEPANFEKVEQILKLNKLPFTIHRHNLQRYVDDEYTRLNSYPVDQELNLDEFNPFNKIMKWMDLITNRCHSDLSCTTYSIGKSYENRTMKVLHISSGVGSKKVGKQMFWIDSTIHGREWLAAASILKMINQLITKYGYDEPTTSLVDTYDWFFLPVMNPDGYVYSWRKERYWRKSRNRNNGTDCYGTDLNRNFDIHWGSHDTATSPCSDVYGGPSPASEPEVKAVQNEALRLEGNITAWLTLHTAGYTWLFPYGSTNIFTDTVTYQSHSTSDCHLTEDYHEMMRVAHAAADASEGINSEGNNSYIHWWRGNSCEVIFPSSGGTADYVKGNADVKYAFTVELRGRGFEVPPSIIHPSFKELWNGVTAMVDAIEHPYDCSFFPDNQWFYKLMCLLKD